MCHISERCALQTRHMLFPGIQPSSSEPDNFTQLSGQVEVYGPPVVKPGLGVFTCDVGATADDERTGGNGMGHRDWPHIYSYQTGRCLAEYSIQRQCTWALGSAFGYTAFGYLPT